MGRIKGNNILYYRTETIRIQSEINFILFCSISAASPKIWRPNVLNLSKQQCLFWDTESRSTNR